MSEHDKGKILEQAAKLPPLLKARAEGFMQGLTAASADNDRQSSEYTEDRHHDTEELHDEPHGQTPQ